MRCLLCYTEDLPPDTAKCPKCGQSFAAMLRDTLPVGYALDHGQYRIEYPVGRGGFGITYRATDTARRFPVAIKEFFVRDLMNRDGSTGGVTLSAEDKERVDRVRQRFQREGRTLLRVQHPNVVRILDLFEQNDTAYLVMEYLGGLTLRSYMTEELTAPDGSTRWQSRLIPPDETRRIMEGLVAALAAVHEAKMFHLDLKPANILIEPDGRVVLIDFGAARQEVGTGYTVPSYTANYAPPEVMTGKKVGPESDIFETGMLLHEMLTGTLPPPASARMFESESAAWQPTDLAEPWRSLVATALRLDPAERPKDVRAWWQSAFPPVVAAATAETPQPPPVAERIEPPLAERLEPSNTDIAGAVETIDQTIRERVTLPVGTVSASNIAAATAAAAGGNTPAAGFIAANAVTDPAAAGPPRRESGGMSTSNNSNTPDNENAASNNSSGPPTPPGGGFDPDNDRTLNMRITPPVASRMAAPPPQAIRTDPPPVNTAQPPPPVGAGVPSTGGGGVNYDDDNDKTVAMRVPRADLSGQNVPRQNQTPLNTNTSGSGGGLQFGPPKAESESMSTTTRAVIVVVILVVLVVIGFVLFGGRR